MAQNNFSAETKHTRIAFQLNGILAAPGLIQIPMNSEGLINRARTAANCLAKMYRSCMIDSVPKYERDFVSFDIIAPDGTHVEEADFRCFVLWFSRMMILSQTQDTAQWSNNPAKDIAQTIDRIRDCGNLSIRIGSNPHLIYITSAHRQPVIDKDIVSVELSRVSRIKEITTPSAKILVTNNFSKALSKYGHVDRNVLETSKHVRRSRAVLIGIAEQGTGLQGLFESLDETMDQGDN